MFLTQPQYSYKQASILCFVNHGPQMLTISVLLVLFETLSHIVTPDTKKATILAFQVPPGQPKMASLGFLLLKLNYWVLGTLYPVEKGLNVFFARSEGHIKQLSMLSKYLGRVGQPIFPKNGGTCMFLTKPQYSYKQASIL